jgi:GDP-L-fucose synthase
MALLLLKIMNKDSKIYIAGHRGMVGSAILRKLEAEGYTNIITRTRAELDLRDQKGVHDFFRDEKPEYTFLAAAKVGGIVANNTYRADFIYENIIVEANVIHAIAELKKELDEVYVKEYAEGHDKERHKEHNKEHAKDHTSAEFKKVPKLLFLGSSCIYPKHAPQPLKEEYLLTGTLEETNDPYAIAKIAGIKMCESYHRQYGCNFISVMPTNLYGPNDNYDLQNSHVLPALLRKFHNAKASKSETVELWGTGVALREFMHVDDLAAACVFLMETYDKEEIVNIGVGEDLTIKELAYLVKDIVGFDGEIVFDSTKPNGTPRKLMDVTRLNELGFKAQIGLKEGITAVYKDVIEKEIFN